jgi:hypothetical protein
MLMLTRVIVRSGMRCDHDGRRGIAARVVEVSELQRLLARRRGSGGDGGKIENENVHKL